jgi:hypothetical protein
VFPLRTPGHAVSDSRLNSNVRLKWNLHCMKLLVG